MSVAPQGGSTMTVLGKILVFVNLLFSLITGALIIMVFVARTNWKAGFEELNKKYQAQTAIIRAREDEVADTTKRKEQVEAALAKSQADLDKAGKDAVAAQTAENALRVQAENRARAAETTLEAAVAEKERRQKEVEALKVVNADKEKKLSELETQIKDFRDRAVNAEISYKAALERNGLLLAQLEKVDRENQQLRNSQAVVGAAGGGAGLSQAGQAPPDDLKGSILAVDSKSGLLSVSLGTDSGLKVGNTLVVYRLEPKPEYLGKIRIVDANFKYAVARPVEGLLASQLKPGDTVASRVSGR
jgi:hypothetical protein